MRKTTGAGLPLVELKLNISLPAAGREEMGRHPAIIRRTPDHLRKRGPDPIPTFSERRGMSTVMRTGCGPSRGQHPAQLLCYTGAVALRLGGADLPLRNT